MLGEYVPKTGYSMPSSSRVLDLGCGRCFEGRVLSDYFVCRHLVGIDANPQKIAKAKEEYTEMMSVPKPKYEFIVGNARKLRKIVNGKFDVVVARHPNVAEIPDVWKEIFSEAKRLMKPESLLIATSFGSKEHEVLEKQLKNLSYEIIFSCMNEYSPSTTGPYMIDKKVLFARKKD